MEKKNLSFIIIICILVLLLGSASGLFVYQNRSYASSKAEYESTISDLNKKIDQLESAGKKKDSIIEEKNETIKTYEETYENLQSIVPELEKVDKEVSFYEYACAIIIDNNSKRYHKYGCSEIDWDSDFSFWVYTTNEAEHKSYYACPTCH